MEFPSSTQKMRKWHNGCSFQVAKNSSELHLKLKPPKYKIILALYTLAF